MIPEDSHIVIFILLLWGKWNMVNFYKWMVYHYNIVLWLEMIGILLMELKQLKVNMHLKVLLKINKDSFGIYHLN